MYSELVKRLHRYSENCVAYKLDADFADAVQQAAEVIEELNRRIGRVIELYNRNVEKSAMYEALMGISPEPPKEE